MIRTRSAVVSSSISSNSCVSIAAAVRHGGGPIPIHLTEQIRRPQKMTDAPKGKRLVSKMTTPVSKFSFTNPALEKIVAVDLPKDHGYVLFPPKKEEGTASTVVSEEVRLNNESDRARCEDTMRRRKLGGGWNDVKRNVHPSYEKQYFADFQETLDWFSDYRLDKITANTNPSGYTQLKSPLDESFRPENIKAAEEKKQLAAEAKK